MTSCIVVVAAVALVLAPPAATAVELEQVTCRPDGTFHGEIALAGDGRIVAFSASADLVGENPLGLPQIFALDLGSGDLRQVTPARPTAARDVATCAAFEAAVADDGRRIVALVTCGDAPRSRLFELRDGMRRALGPFVRCAMGLSPRALSADGRVLVVEAQCNPTRRGPRRRPTLATRPPVAWVQDRPGRRMRPFGPRGRCATLAPSVSPDGARVTFLSECDPLGRNPTHAVNVFASSRADGRTAQLTDAVHLDAGGRCGLVQKAGVRRSGLFDPPAITASGAVAFPATCIDESDPGRFLFHRLWFAEPGSSRPHELPLPPCLPATALRVLDAPISVDAAGTALATVAVCSSDVTSDVQDLLVLRPGSPPFTVLRSDGYQDRIRRTIGRPMLDASGTTLATLSAQPPPGCGGAGTRQIVLARHLDDPVLRRVTCACPPGS